MTNEEVHFRLRLPADMRDKITEQAEVNQRSINAEVVALLKMALAEGDDVARIKKDITRILERLSTVEKRLLGGGLELRGGSAGAKAGPNLTPLGAKKGKK